MKPSTLLSTRLAITIPAGFDPTTGKMPPLALLTIGEVLGRGYCIDAKTLTTCFAAIQGHGGRLRGYLTHNHEGPTHWEDAKDCADAFSELNMAGFFSAIAIAKEQLIASSFEFYDSFKEMFAPQYKQLIELMAKTPDLCGLSIETWYYLVYVGTDGTEYAALPEDIALAYNGLPAMRIEECFAAAFGAVPAANPGLFARLSAFGGKHGGLKKLAHYLAAELGLQAAPEELSDDKTVHPAPLNRNPSTSASPLMKIIADLKAKYGNDDKRLGQALLIVGKSSTLDTLTVEAVEAQMATADLTAERDTSRGQVTTLTAELTTAKGQITTLTAELATAKAATVALQTRFDALKTSGVDPVGTGVPSGGATGAEDNPFVSGNLSAQALLTKSDPARAKALKEAAKTAKAATNK
jgi:hypothetical protein